jgi:hypothetical protein
MDIRGHVQNGVVIFEGPAFPEGTPVIVSALAPTDQDARRERRRVQLPLVAGSEAGSVQLTNERVSEILAAEDIESVRRSWNASS